MILLMNVYEYLYTCKFATGVYNIYIYIFTNIYILCILVYIMYIYIYICRILYIHIYKAYIIYKIYKTFVYVNIMYLNDTVQFSLTFCDNEHHARCVSPFCSTSDTLRFGCCWGPWKSLLEGGRDIWFTESSGGIHSQPPSYIGLI